MNCSSVCVYAGFSDLAAQDFKLSAQKLGTTLAQRGINIVYGAGGGGGLMGLVANSALDAGGKVCGIIPEHLLAKESPPKNLTELFVVSDMHTRKQMMVNRSDAFIILPGGLGTLDETFEILTWKKLELHNKPIILFNQNGYWNDMLALIDKTISAGFALPTDKSLFEVTDSVEGVFAILEKSANDGSPKQDRRLMSKA